jgi:hypothetical protein
VRPSDVEIERHHRDDPAVTVARRYRGTERRAPRLTVRLTLAPFRRRVPGAGFWETTRPRFTLAEYASRTLPTLQWPRTIAFFAVVSALPLTFGTTHFVGDAGVVTTALTVVVTVAELFPAVGSVDVVDAFAVFVTVPGAVARATIVTVASPPMPIGPRSQ